MRTLQHFERNIYCAMAHIIAVPATPLRLLVALQQRSHVAHFSSSLVFSMMMMMMVVTAFSVALRWDLPALCISYLLFLIHLGNVFRHDLLPFPVLVDCLPPASPSLLGSPCVSNALSPTSNLTLFWPSYSSDLHAGWAFPSPTAVSLQLSSPSCLCFGHLFVPEISLGAGGMYCCSLLKFCTV